VFTRTIVSRPVVWGGVLQKCGSQLGSVMLEEVSVFTTHRVDNVLVHE